MANYCVSPNFELSPYGGDKRGIYVLEFPDHIHRDMDGDPHLSVVQLIELRYMLDHVIPDALGLL
jgi:hypothetical protein